MLYMTAYHLDSKSRDRIIEYQISGCLDHCEFVMISSLGNERGLGGGVLAWITQHISWHLLVWLSPFESDLFGIVVAVPL